MSALENCRPEKVFHFFGQICSVPHGSGNTKAISDLCARFAADRGLEHYQDGVNNVIIIKEASSGYENEPAVILQGHMDMVCVKTADRDIDFTTDPISVFVDGDWVRADRTSLGGDNGIAVAMIMAILDDDALPHPRIEAVFTVDEEVGMDGAAALDVTPLKGRRLINLDSEEFGEFTVGCAGGLRADCTVPVRREKCALPHAVITIDGLRGGHSGMEIDKGRASANALMGRVLNALYKTAPFRLVSASGGRLDNVICSAATAEIAADSGCLDALKAEAARIDAALKHEYASSDEGVTVSFAPAEGGGDAVCAEDTGKVIYALFCSPQGVQEMSMAIPGLVQTSLNMGVMKLESDALRCSFSVRSSFGTQKEMLFDRLTAVYAAVGGTVTSRSEYPAWEYAVDSPLRDTMVKVFTDMFGHEPKIVATHGGLECGLFAEKLPGLDCVALGPDLKAVHSVDERLSISSTEKIFELVKAVLAAKN